jgi:glutathione S-transferase/alpha,alpha-trehalase
MTVAMLLAATPGLVLHGTSGSRSPLVNWFTNEAKIPLTMAPPRPSNHPFGQVPFLTDDGGVEVFESGAILLYIADKYGGPAYSTPEKRAKYGRWVVWSNAELDGLCFGAVPGDHRVRGSSMGNTQIKAVATLEAILGKCEWLVDDEFSVADVAVGAYLNCARSSQRCCHSGRALSPMSTLHTSLSQLSLVLSRCAPLLPQHRPVRHAQHGGVYAALRRAAGLCGRLWPRPRRHGQGQGAGVAGRWRENRGGGGEDQDARVKDGRGGLICRVCSAMRGDGGGGNPRSSQARRAEAHLLVPW